MKRNIENIFVLAQKEFADSVWSPRFYLILGIFTTVLLAYGYETGQNMSYMNGKTLQSPLVFGFSSFASQISIFGGLLAIGLGFDTIVKEKKSGSLNVLLTHPVYRDQVITGKLIGMMVTLGLATLVSVAISTGVMLSVSGITISTEMIGRLIVFMVLAFLFMLSYLALSIAVSTFTKESSNSLMYSIATWLALTVLLGIVASAVAGMITGQGTYGTSEGPSSMEKRIKIGRDIMSISPSKYFMELIMGPPGGFSDEKPSGMRGLFDTGFTLGHWVEQNWVNLVVLIVIPVILILTSYMAFMRQDITL